MKNTDLFAFPFTDRINERRLLKYFFNQKEDQSNILWIDGNSGAGKTYFIQETIKKGKFDYNNVYVNKTGNDKSQLYITLLIKELDNCTNSKFVDFFKSNYTHIIDIAKRATETAMSLAGISDFGITETVLDLSKKFISKTKEEHRISEVLQKYINEFIKKKKLVIILDNFTLCDSESFDIISDILFYYHNNSCVKFILITTHEILTQKTDIINLLAEKIDVETIKIYPFKDSNLFVNMLEDIYDLRKYEKEDISALYDICEGYPQRLKTFLINLYAKDGINFKLHKAQIKYEQFKELIIKESINFNYDGLKYEEKYILQLIALWGTPISLNILKALNIFIQGSDILYECINNDIIINTILELENIGILERSYQEDGNCKLKFKHDSLYYATLKYVENRTVNSQFFHFSMLNFIKSNQDLIKNNEYDYLTSLHSFYSKSQDWKDYNYNYAVLLHEKKQYLKAYKIFKRLVDYLYELENEQKMAIAVNTYEVGLYDETISVLEYIEIKNLNKQKSIEYHFLLIKAYIMKLNYQKALDIIENILNSNIILENNELIDIMYLKFTTLCMIPLGYESSEKCFKYLIQKYPKSNAMIKVYQTAMDYYKGETSLRYLRKGLSIAQSLQKELDCALIKHNMGFEYFRSGMYNEAETFTTEAIEIIDVYKPHETSYCLNNLASVYMVKEDWEIALYTLKEALFKNRSTYAAYAIKGNMMICNYYLGNEIQYNKIMQELSILLIDNNYVDDKLFKKILTNRAFILMQIGDYQEAKNTLEKTIKYTKTISVDSSARVRKMLGVINGTPYNIPFNEYRNYYFNLPYEPWLITFGHE